MRGSVVGLSLVGRVLLGRLATGVQPPVQDDTINDLAQKYNITMEAIALQTKHIVDEMNDKGHEIRTIFVSGGQAKNVALMQLIANTCNMPVIIPHSSSTAVVTGAAMLGRFAAEATKKGAVGSEEGLWDIMVRWNRG
jgi:ribulose kinase